MGKYKRLGINTLLIFVGNMGSKLIGLIMLPFYTRWLGPEQYGVSDVLNTYATVLLSLVTCSMAEALFVFPKDKIDNEKRIYFSTGVIFVFGTTFITAFVFFLIDLFAKGHNSFIDNIWLLFLLLFAQIFQTVFQQFTRSINKIKVYSITGFIVTVATAILGCMLVPYYGLSGYIWSVSIAYLIGAIYSILFSGSYKYFDIKGFDNNHLKEMLKYCLPLLPSALTWWVIGAMNRPIMESYMGLHDLGIFAVASKFPNLLNSLFVIFGVSWQISVLEEFGKSDYDRFFNNTVRCVFSIISVGVILMTACSKQLILIFASDEFYEAWRLVPILMVGTLLGNLASMFGTNFLASKQSKYMLFTSLWASAAALIMNFMLIPFAGLMGAAISTVFSMGVLALSRIYYSKRYVSMTNISEYILILIVLTLYIILYTLTNNMILSSLGCFVSIIIICMQERRIIIAVLGETQNIKRIIAKLKK